MEKDKKIYGHCRACHMNCPVYYTVQDGRVTDIQAAPMDETGLGELCPRGMASIEFEYSPTRVRYPLKRAGKRGEGKWERISWDQACKEIAEKIYDMSQKYGPETFVLPGRTGRQDMGWIAARIARTIGTPNNYYGPIQLCLLPQFHDVVQFGNYLAQKVGTDPNTRLLVTFGHEFTSYAEPILGKFQTMAYQNGLEHIALDPVCGASASKATLWLPVRPGTDLAYCLCVIRDLIEKDAYDKAFVKEWTNLSFLVNPDTGALLTEADIIEGGREQRYMFWDANSNSPKWWDAEETQWEGGVSGKAHYDMCVDRWNRFKGTNELSPARLPENVDPALMGSYEIAFKDGKTRTVQPAFQMLADNVAEWTVEKTEEITGIPADKIEQSCEKIRTIHPIEFYQGCEYMSTNTSQYCNAVAILKAMTGNIEEAGGSTFIQFYPVEPMAFPGEWDLSYNAGLDPAMKKKRLGYDEHPIGCGKFNDEEWVHWLPQRPENADALCVFPDICTVIKAAETGDPYEVHGIIAVSSNWLLHDPATPRWLKLLNDEEKIQLHVVTEMVMTPTAEMADYVLPAATWMERNYLEFGTSGATPYKNFYRKAIDPMWEAKQDYYFGAKLAHELEKLDPKYNHGLLNPETSFFFGGEEGVLWENDTIDEERDRLTRRFFGKSLEECFDERRVYAPEYESAGVEDHRYLIAGRFPTSTGKCNLFSTAHQKYGFPPLPVYTEPMESPLSQPEVAKEYPLVLSTGKRQPGYFHSEFRQLPLMRSLSPTPDVFINPETAEKYGVDHGDWVWVEAPPTFGRQDLHRIMGRVNLRFTMRPDMVSYSQHAWWRPEKGVEDDLHGALEWNAEVLCDAENCTPETGTLGVRSLLCKIYPCTSEDIEKYQPMITRDQLEAMAPVYSEEA